MERKLPDWMVNFKNKLTAHEKCRGSTVLSFKGKIRFIKEFGDCCYICEALLQKVETVNQLVLGVDLEWPIKWIKGVGQGKTALVQMCPSAEVCYIFHVIEWKQLPKIFTELISHPKVLLVGVNIQGDIWKLGRDFGISVMPIISFNVIDLHNLANKIFSVNENWSLARLVMYVLKKQLNKSSELRISNWAGEELTAKQLMYAATDAYVSLEVYKRLKEIESGISINSKCLDAPLKMY